MLGGRGVVLSEQSAVTQAELFVCVELHDAGKAEMIVHQASAVERDWLPPDKLQVSIDLEFDATRGRVVAVRRTRYEDLVLDESPTSVPSDDRAAALLAREAAARLERSQWLSEAAQSFAVRVNFLRQWMPELELPALDDEQLDGLLPQICQGCTSFDQLPRAPVLDVLRRQFTPQQLWAIDRDAPERLQVPSGSKIALVYEPGRPPVLAVRIQELFGLHQTPRVAGGRASVLLHLLAPNMRSQQVTDDLAGFWERTYPTVRKELKRRYPKHAWPDDPRHASAEYMPGRKR
jgi:ATP-dependent helicase HrpB